MAVSSPRLLFQRLLRLQGDLQHPARQEIGSQVVQRLLPVSAQRQKFNLLCMQPIRLPQADNDYFSLDIGRLQHFLFASPFLIS